MTLHSSIPRDAPTASPVPACQTLPATGGLTQLILAPCSSLISAALSCGAPWGFVLLRAAPSDVSVPASC